MLDLFLKIKEMIHELINMPLILDYFNRTKLKLLASTLNESVKNLNFCLKVKENKLGKSRLILLNID